MTGTRLRLVLLSAPEEQKQQLKDLITSYEFWMKDANGVRGPKDKLLEPISARAIAEHALNEHWNTLEPLIPGGNVPVVQQPPPPQTFWQRLWAWAK